jgi:ribosomal protein S18 acetylase RimI-like enzyme
VVIRRARAQDLETVGRLTVAAYAPYLEGSDSNYVEHLRDTARRDLEAEVWVALDGQAEGGTVLGSVTSCPEGSPWRELAQPGEGEFRMLAVDPAAQGRGVGRALVQHVVDGFRADGSRGVVLCSMTTMTPAHRIYEGLGFARAPELDWSPVPGVDLVAYRLDFVGGQA